MKTKELRLLIREELAKELENSSLITPINEKLDPVGKEDDDIDNDGDSDKSDEYLANRRKAVSKAIKNEAAPKMKREKWLDELDQATQLVLRAERMLKLDQPGTHGKVKNSFKKTIKTIQKLTIKKHLFCLLKKLKIFLKN